MADESKPPSPVGPTEAPTKPPAAGGGSTTPSAKLIAKVPVTSEPWSGAQLDRLNQRLPGAVSEATIFRGMPTLRVAKEFLFAVCELLKSDEGGAYTLLTDETAVDYPKREKRFDIVYHLYSFKRNDRLRLKVAVGEDEKVPSVVSVWPTANWLEREVYDMFGVQYEGHPDLKRILMPDGWVGHPLRKDYDILRQDEAWVQANLKIKSAQ
jgi:NADH-quinone oxidoreductase subunit C